nr:MAG TPA: hypothetical protein [Caudoviricetes sp.]
MLTSQICYLIVALSQFPRFRACFIQSVPL